MVKEGSLNNQDELQIMTTLSCTRRKLTNKEFEFFYYLYNNLIGDEPKTVLTKPFWKTHYIMYLSKGMFFNNLSSLDVTVLAFI